MYRAVFSAARARAPRDFWRARAVLKTAVARRWPACGSGLPAAPARACKGSRAALVGQARCHGLGEKIARTCAPCNTFFPTQSQMGRCRAPGCTSAHEDSRHYYLRDDDRICVHVSHKDELLADGWIRDMEAKADRAVYLAKQFVEFKADEDAYKKSLEKNASAMAAAREEALLVPSPCPLIGKVMQCGRVCERTHFGSRTQKYTHVAECHYRMGEVGCVACGTKLGNKSDLRTHIRGCHMFLSDDERKDAIEASYDKA